ncbi:Double-stranded RNA binding motif family protein [Ferroglobus placidus DSM 10642]|uniref:Double-stranded RNA binding motif family protein n=1 Tax=Ferroglobus placidus (strain DSM 10642 / AEDII12DO) TaxID=589924 RepID=D3RY15_FERPA|nr:hypothetical protein [Ferroglobus placidus]ADC65378.1 Double-stranded RNA binding motif family protein [Ferroglobus placidus DSM 10642]
MGLEKSIQSKMPNEDLLGKTWSFEANKTMYLEVNLTVSYDNTLKNLTIKFPLLYVKYSIKEEKYTHISVFTITSTAGSSMS